MSHPNAMPRSVLDEPTLVINRSWLPIHVTAVRRALVMVYRGVAGVVESESLAVLDFWTWMAMRDVGERWVSTPSTRIPAPEVIQVVSYDKVPSYTAPFSRSNLFQRDQHTCQYCGQQPSSEQLSIDHVLPRSKGGQTSWSNCVLACRRCNARKGNRTLGDAGMTLRRPPRPPRWSPCLSLRTTSWLASWDQFLVPTRRRKACGE